MFDEVLHPDQVHVSSHLRPSVVPSPFACFSSSIPPTNIEAYTNPYFLQRNDKGLALVVELFTEDNYLSWSPSTMELIKSQICEEYV